MAERRLQLGLPIAPELRQWIESDELRLKQILFNLIDHAVRHATGSVVSVTAAKGRGRDGSRLLVSVHDSGTADAPPEPPRSVFPRHLSSVAGEPADRSAERRVGKECARTGRTRWSPDL